MFKISKYLFSSKRLNGVNLVAKFNYEFYSENFDKCLVQNGFPQAAITINNTKVQLIGVPIVNEGAEQIYDKNLNELQTLMQQICNNDSDFLIQLDPSPYLYNKRQISAKYMGKSHQLDEILNQTPLLPLEYSELQLQLGLFDIMYLIRKKQEQNIPDDKHIQEVQKLINDPLSGYFTSFLNQKSEINPDEFQNNFSDIALSSLMYEHAASSQKARTSTPYLMSALFYGLLSGSTYLGDLSRVYTRIYQGQVLKLEDLQLLFKEMFSKKLSIADLQTVLPFEAAQLQWRQFLKDYYLLFTINKIANGHKKATQLNVFIENLHFEPLRQLLVAQGGELLDDVQYSYFEQFKFPTQGLEENDEQMIEKHALLDFIEGFPIWKEKLIRDPFPYLSQNYLKLSPLEQKEVQKTFFKYSSNYQRVVNQVAKMQKTQKQ